MTIEYIDHVAVGKSRLVTYFKDKENMLTLLGMLLSKLDDLELDITKLAGIKDLSTVTGIWLDYLGKIVGIDRDGLEDELYRAEIQLKIAINNSDGTAPVIQEIIRTYTKSDYVRLGEGIMSYGQMIFNGTQNANKPLYDLMQDLVPVTTFVLTSQNTNNACYLPPWETEVAELNPFYVVDEFGNEELFEVTLSVDVPPVQFFVQTGATSSFDSDTPSDTLVEWEGSDPTTLNFTEYDYLDLEEDNPLLLSNVTFNYNQDTPFLWEIDETSSLVDGYEQWLLDLLEVYPDVETIEELFILLSEVPPNLPDA